MHNIEFYEDSNGRSELWEFLESLRVKAATNNKEHVRTVDPEIGKDIDEVENISSIVSTMVEQRTSLGLSQRELAAMCGQVSFHSSTMIPY